MDITKNKKKTKKQLHIHIQGKIAHKYDTYDDTTYHCGGKRIPHIRSPVTIAVAPQRF